MTDDMQIMGELDHQADFAMPKAPPGSKVYSSDRKVYLRFNDAVQRKAQEIGAPEPDQPEMTDEELMERIERFKNPKTTDTLVQMARATAPEPVVNTSPEAMLLNKNNEVNNAYKIYELFEGEPFDGLPEDAIDYALDAMGEFSFNFLGPVSFAESGFDAGGTLAQAAHIISAQDPEKAKAFVDFMAEYERLPTWSYEGVGRAFRGIFSDPTTYATAGAGYFLSKAGTQVAATGAKRALQELAKRPMTLAAAEGAVYAGGGEEALMGVEEASGREISGLEKGLRRGISTTIGAAAGPTLMKGMQAGGQVIGEIAEAVGKPTMQAVGNVIEEAGEAAQARIDEPGEKLGMGVDIDPLIAGAGDLVKGMRGGDSIELSDAERAGTLIDELYGEGTIEPGGNLYDVAVKLNQKSKAGGDRSEQNNENQEAIAKMMAAEIMEAMKAKGNAADWYKTKITNAMSIASRLYPELATDQTAASSFKFIMAITSNGADVATNVVNTVDAYGVYRKTNKMPIVGYGREKPSMEFGFRLFNELEEKLGSREEVFKLLNTKMKVRDLVKIGQEYGFKISGENMGTELPASAMFGPKIGGAFYQNLEGNMDMLTMDRWFMRMWGRMSGTLIPERSPALLAKQQSRARSATTPELAQEYGFVYDDIINDDTILSDFASAVHKKFAAGNFKDKREFTRSMKALDEGGTKVLETPSGGGHRSYMRATVDRAVELLREQGMQTDAASAQALLWYPEKELYGKLGVGNKKSAPTDYEAELAKIAKERGIDVSDITGQP